jgi:hypothetical protein
LNQKSINKKHQYFYDKGYYDRIYICEEESNKINKMKYKEKQRYKEQHNIYVDLESTNNNYERYYTVKYWDLTEEDLILFSNIDNNIKLTNIEKYVKLIFIIILISAILGLVLSFG